jgi:hypothetical protein
MLSLTERIHHAEIVSDAELTAFEYDGRQWMVEFQFGDNQEYGADVFVYLTDEGELCARSNGVSHVDNLPIDKSLIRKCEEKAIEFVEEKLSR